MEFLKEAELIGKALTKLKENPTEYNRDAMIFLLSEMLVQLMGYVSTIKK